MVIQFQAGLARSQTVTLSSQELSRLAVKRTTGYRALEQLRIAGLVDVERGNGKLPRVTITPPRQEANETHPGQSDGASRGST
jgi:hypothetical protein